MKFMSFLSGWHISTCLPRQYHFVADAKNWTDAQTYCRQTYTDLVTIQNAEELDEFISTLSSAGYNSEVWIGLYNEIDWKWSNGYTGIGADYQTWTSGTQQNPEFVFVNEISSWSSAQRYCRENYIDLATVTSDGENQKLQMISSAWIGLYRNPNVLWSDGSSFFYSNFNYGPNRIRSMTVTCGFSSLQSSGTWNFWPCKTKLPFVCYYDPPVSHRQMLKLSINLDPSLELNMNVKEDLLKMNKHYLSQLQERLKEKGISGGVTLKWRKQSDGKVFHKDEDATTVNPSCEQILT
ncbi:putative C-type lectin domain family 20 member A isoform X1 [Oreochromis niloticus]|uniref:putative C-type lectin domain family 20 member A isoform X1 n=1 Tax=Oreochromis niloticus TaxID=8128 RepID=UPI00090479A6|nr:putative C-type lectin domain family 20 member A isoform X1 [Oreochromis niloticus]